MAKIEGEITIKVSNAKELKELNSNIKKAIKLNNELNDILKDIQRTKLTITTEASQLSTSVSSEDGNDEDDASYKENCVANSIINQLNSYDLEYSNWMHIINTVERGYSPYPINSAKKEGI